MIKLNHSWSQNYWFMLPSIFLEAPWNYAFENKILSVDFILYISMYNLKISHAALMVTSTLEFNNSVCLNPGKKADCASRLFGSLWWGWTSDVLQIQRRSSLFFSSFFGGIADPKVTSSHRIQDSINCIVIAHYQSSELAIHMDIAVHVLNGSQLTNLRIVCQLQ